MDKNLNDKWLLLKQYCSPTEHIYARKMSSVIGVDFDMNKHKRTIRQIATPESINFSWIVDSTGKDKAIIDFNAKSLEYA